MKPQSKADALEYLTIYAENNGLEGPYQAAQEVLKNYQMWDYNYSDVRFLAYCEEILEEVH